MTGPAGTELQDQVAVRPSSRAIAQTVLRVAGSVIGLVVLYFWLPLDRASQPVAITMLVIVLVAFVTLVAFQVRWIIRSRFPFLRGVECLATSIPFFLFLFASTYVVLAAESVGSFGGPLSHTVGLYFTVTVFSTDRFGDITAKTEAAPLVVTGQMLADLIVLGVALKIIVGAVRRGQQRRSMPRAAPGTGAGDDEQSI